MKYVWGILATVFVVAGAATLRPDLLPGAEDWVLRTPMAHVMALRSWLALGFAGVALFLFVFAAIRRALVGSGRIALATAVAYLLMALFHGGTILARGVESPDQLGPDRGVTVAGVGNGEITVLSFNTLGGSIDLEEITAAVVRSGVDVVVLTETSSSRGQEVADQLAGQSLAFQRFDNGADPFAPEFRSTVVLISTALGEYTQVAAAGLPGTSVVAVPADGLGPRIIGVHPYAPMLDDMDKWEADIASVYSVCAGGEPFIMAGDFNSTIDHQMALGASCADARVEAGAGALGTWPTSLPALLGTPIDRVLHDGATYRGVEATTIPSGESDHRGIVVRLAPLG